MRAPAPARGLSAGYGSMASSASTASSTPMASPRSAEEDPGAPLSSLAAPMSSSASAQPPAPKVVTVDEEIDAIGVGRFHAAAVCVLGLANASDAVELLCVSFILPRLPHDAFNDADRAVLSSAIFVGMLVGGLVFGAASDRLGRRGALVAALLVNAVFGALSAVCPERPYGLLVATRVMGGFGVGGSIPGVFSLVAELLPTLDRGFYITLVAWFWMVGSLYAAGAAWLMIGTLGMSWRLYALACAFPALAAAGLVAALLPESPRYLVLAGRPAAAEASLLYIARWNGADSRLTRGYRLAPSASAAVTPAAQGASAAPDGALAGDWGRTGAAAQHGKGASAAPAPPAADAFSIGGEDGDDDGAHAGARGGAGAVASASASMRGIATSLELVAGSAARAAPAARVASTLAAHAAGEDEGGDERVGLTASPNGAAGGAGGRGWLAPLWSLLSGPAGSEAPPAAGVGPGAPSPLQQFFSPQLRRTALPLMAVWFCLSLGWYGLTLWIPTIFAESDIELDEFQDAFLVQAANLPGNIVSSLLVDRVGRKAVLSWSLVLACCAAAAFPFARSEWSVLLCACLLNAASTCTWNALDVLSTEAFPTSLRATAMGVLAATGRVGSMSGQFVFGSLIHVSLFALLGVAAGVLLLGAAAGALLPRDGTGRKLGEELGEEEAREGRSHRGTEESPKE